ncbi:hypothetical protein E2K98_23895 [Bacillus salipaludis]|uniref:Uncharacterized protein n=1 Tax=Bacillus salipaludis TaxID=2547811 RepID=A0A4R5VLT7_9BACI|nr:hypothetical protein [Bacillus salipaludis]MDQ6599037.1 hypothetical protein [Bacillus salipaludis]TDK58272.1 hypothetical protein E2K98_23895 [Bacillus salipaludis]
MNKKSKVVSLKKYKKMKRKRKNPELLVVIPVFLTIAFALFVSHFVRLNDNLEIHTFTDTHAYLRK